MVYSNYCVNISSRVRELNLADCKALLAGLATICYGDLSDWRNFTPARRDPDGAIARRRGARNDFSSPRRRIASPSAP
jgi:hypothetical protein